MNEAIYKNEYMQNLFRHIENNISDELEAKLLSSVGNVSRRKLYYDFYSLSGHTVKEYIRKRRLSNALALIKMSDMGFTDIAFQCGYSSYPTLWRAIKQTLALSPSEYKNGNTYYFFPPFNGKPLQSVTVSKDTIPCAIRVLFYHSKLTNIENLAVKTFMQVYPDYSGRIFGRNGKQRNNNFCYELYLTDTTIKPNKLTSHGFEVANETPCLTTTFATSTVQNDEPKINAAWDYLYSEWLQNSMFEYTNESYYEEYILKNGKPNKLKLYLPIKERSEDTKITLIDNPGLYFITAKAKGHNAEEIASQAVMNFVTIHYPYILNSSSEIYLRKEPNLCICGLEIDTGFPFFKYETFGKFSTTEKHYLVLESSVMGDYDRYADMLLCFIRDNGMDADDKEIFAVYNTDDSFRSPKIKMYCPVKVCTK